MANYPQELAQDAVCQSHTGHITGHWFLPAWPLRLNTNEWMNGWWRTFSCTCSDDKCLQNFWRKSSIHIHVVDLSTDEGYKLRMDHGNVECGGCWVESTGLKVESVTAYEYRIVPSILEEAGISFSGVLRNFVPGGGFNKFNWGQRTERTGIWSR